MSKVINIKNIIISLYFIGLTSFTSVFADPTPVATNTASLDEVVAVAEKDVIMRSDLDARIAQTRQQIQSHNAPMPPDDVLTKQVLNNLILESLQLQLAEKAGIRIDDNTLNQQMAKIAAQNNMTLAQFSQALSSEGTSYPAVREQVRREMMMSQLRQRQVGQRVRVNDQEVNRALSSKNHKDGTEYHLAEILIKPTNATPEALKDAQKQAEDVYTEAKSGRSFAQLAAAHSNAPEAKSGGDLGWRPINQLTPNISAAIVSLNTNDISQPIQDQSGIHIVKVLGKRGATEDASAGTVTEYHARHILISPSKIRSDDQAQKLISEIKAQIDQGVDFGQLAKKYSDDPSSASQGGDLGWSTADKYVKEFAHELETLPEKTVSSPFRSQFGWHILEVLGTKKENNAAQTQEDSTRDALRKQKYDDELKRWLNQIRQEAFVDIKIDQ